MKWKCVSCGQTCYADENPTEGFPKWADGHICKFEEDTYDRWGK
jgi:hypothetical protein